MTVLTDFQVFGPIGADVKVSLFDALQGRGPSLLNSDNSLEILSHFLLEITKAYAVSFPNGASGYVASVRKSNVNTEVQRLTFAISIDHSITVDNPVVVSAIVPEA